MLYRTIAPFALGVDAQNRPHVIDSSSFNVLQQLRVYQGVIQNFPGWATILAGSGVGAFGTMLEEFIDLSGNSHLLCAGPDKVYTYDPSTKLLTDITGAAILNTTRDDPWWPFFFNDSLYFTNKNDGVYKWNGGTIVNVPSAPKAKTGGVIAAHLCLFNVNDGSDHPQRFQWAAEATDNVWTALPSNDAGSFDISESGDVGIGALPFQDDLVLYKEFAVIQITFIGGNEVFGRRYTIRGVGLLGTYAVLDVGGEHIFMGPDTFYRYLGGSLTNDVGLKIKDRVYPTIDFSKRSRIRSVFIQGTREALFMYPSTKAGDDADFCVIYNTQEQQWYGPFPILSTMAGRTTKNAVIVVDSVPDIVDTVATIVDQFPSGGSEQPRVLYINDSGDLREIGASQDDNGNPITRVIESGDHFLGLNAVDAQGNAVSVLPESVFQAIEVNLEFTDTVPIGTLQLFVEYRMRLADLLTTAGPFMVDIRPGRVKQPIRLTGRWFRIRMIVANSQQVELAGYQYGFTVVGRR